ncbi:MAG: cyclic lactone autoinducer peptide [Cytophagales bacterium]|nr:MAG: cyclic lactone autoinducer peptide [Cytophagales bacterium]
MKSCLRNEQLRFKRIVKRLIEFVRLIALLLKTINVACFCFYPQPERPEKLILQRNLLF